MLLALATLSCIAVSLIAYPKDDLTFHFDEGGAVTTLSTLMLVAAAASFAFVVYLPRRECGMRVRLTWLSMIAGLAFLAADEQLEFHERIGGFLEELIRAKQYGLPEMNDLIVIACGIAAIPAFLMTLPGLGRARGSLSCLLLTAPFFALHTGLDSIDIEDDPVWFITEETAKLFCVALILAAMLNLLVRAINDGLPVPQDLYGPNERGQR